MYLEHSIWRKDRTTGRMSGGNEPHPVPPYFTFFGGFRPITISLLTFYRMLHLDQWMEDRRPCSPKPYRTVTAGTTFRAVSPVMVQCAPASTQMIEFIIHVLCWVSIAVFDPPTITCGYGPPMMHSLPYG